ncbi:serine hydrolase domain-containing protein [Nonomuraea sp. NPDC050404]|uniref:serine hydrolase domain-containing protein n=1 Tax=Nonomuraea sp. NPDC050404 TaxID=3155783 RepID=UPI0034068FF2
MRLARGGGVLVRVAAVVVAVAVGVPALLLAPWPPEVGSAATGDAALGRLVRQHAGADGYEGLSVALIEGGRTRFAGLGTGDGSRPADQDTAYEIGSVAKVMTGMLLADLAGKGLSPDTPVRDLLPDAGLSTPATLAELASHRSGLPRQRMTPQLLAGVMLMSYTGRNPYGVAGRDEVLADAAAVGSEGRGEVAYSNLGMALLGLALAERSGMRYADLLRTGLLDPLGMASTVVIDPQDDLPARHAVGRARNGLVMDPWRDHGNAGAGGAFWSTAGDLARLVAAVMDGSAPGADAAAARWDETERRRIGYGWFTTRYGDRALTWHNGATGGFTSFVGFDPVAQRGVVVLGNTSKSVDSLGLRLLGVEEEGGERGLSLVTMVVMVVFAFGGLGLAVSAARGRVPDRLSAVGRWLTALLLVVVARNGGPWDVVPPLVWIVGAGVLAAAAALTVVRWPGLPLSRGGAVWWSWAGVALPGVLLVVLGVALVV